MIAARPFHCGAGDIDVGEGTDPAVTVVEVEQRTVVTAGDEADLAHPGFDGLEEVELRVMELHVGSEQVDGDIDDQGATRLPVRLVEICR